MLDALCGLTPALSRLPASALLAKRFSRKSRFFSLIEFWQNHLTDFSFTRRQDCVLQPLGIKLSIRDVVPHQLNTYFEAARKYRFVYENDRVFMFIGSFEFELPFPQGILELRETFENDTYGFFDVKDNVVVDVGAFIGDSAVYFAGRSAQKVVAFEASPFLAHFAKVNVGLNGFGGKVTVVNKAVFDSDGVTCFTVQRNLFGSSSAVKSFKEGTRFEIPTVSLSTLVDELGHIDLLKLDCEGSEHVIVRQAFETKALSCIDKILMEVHGLEYRELLQSLQKARFKILKMDRYLPDLHFLIAERQG